jgi:hypothetical protein
MGLNCHSNFPLNFELYPVPSEFIPMFAVGAHDGSKETQQLVVEIFTNVR